MTIPTGYAQANLVFAGNALLQGAEVTIGMINSGGATASAIAAAVGGAWETNVAPVTTDQVTLANVLCKVGPDATGPHVIVVFGTPGDLAQQSVPSNTAVLATKVTGFGGRKNRGRSFWPGATENQTDGNGLLTAGALTAWQAALSGFYDELGTANLDMVVLHSGSETPTAVVDYEVQQTFATQRDRLRR